MSYDEWKATNPAERYLGPEPGTCPECDDEHHEDSFDHLCECTDCVEGHLEFERDYMEEMKNW